jgi:hypothetical protein
MLSTGVLALMTLTLGIRELVAWAGAEKDVRLDQAAGLEINLEKTKYMLLSRHQNAGQNRDIKTANMSVQNVSLLKYLVTTVTYKNFIQEEIKRKLNSGNACCHSI